jgi:hypothetical protein
MEQFELLGYVVAILEQLGLRYFVTGSTATIFYGEPRLTNDVDIVVELPESRVSEFCQRFRPDDFYLSEEAARQAVQSKSQFNIIHSASGLKIDIIIPNNSAFNESRFNRRQRLHVLEKCDPYFASPEDTIVKKMLYYHEGGSAKHLRDITGVLKAGTAKIDLSYIANWSAQLGVSDIWNEILKRMGHKQ